MFLPSDWHSKENEFMSDYCKCEVPMPAKKAFGFKKSCKLAPLPPAVPCIPQVGPSPKTHDIVNFDWEPCDYGDGWKPKLKQEGKTPMRYNDNYASANACVSTPESDTVTQRNYFIRRLENASYPKEQKYVALFNLYVDNTPKTYKDMIDAIKGGKYTIDPKIEKHLAAIEADVDGDCEYFSGPLYGIVWEGPQADRPGYDQAVKDLKKQKTAAMDAIMSGDAATMKAAVEAFEAWVPAATSN